MIRDSNGFSLAAPTLRLRGCPRCDGAILVSGAEPSCLNCGYSGQRVAAPVGDENGRRKCGPYIRAIGRI